MKTIGNNSENGILSAESLRFDECYQFINVMRPDIVKSIIDKYLLL